MDRREVESRETAAFIGGFMGGFITIGLLVVALFVAVLMKRG